MTVAPARISTYQVLLKVYKQRTHGNVALASVLDQAGLSAADAALTTEIVQGVWTWQRLLDHWIAQSSTTALEKMQPEVHVLLRMSAYQLRFLDRVPAYAIVSDAVEIAKTAAPHVFRYINGVLRGLQRATEFVTPLLDPPAADMNRSEVALRLSYPDWLVDHLCEALGQEVGYQTLWAMNQRVERTVRVNALKCTRLELINVLHASGVEAEPCHVSQDGVRISGRVSVTALPAYRDGLFTLQGESSMLIAPLLGDVRGKRVLDACAAPGGKCTHIAERGLDQVDITAVDLQPKRVSLIEKQVQRLGLQGIHPVAGDVRTMTGVYDAVLVDAPCTGLGAIARKPDLKWAVTAKSLHDLPVLQLDLLDHLADRVRSQGTLVYSTCTISPMENEDVVTTFLAHHADYTLDDCGSRKILPQDFGGDGFFVAVLRKC